MQQPSSSHNGPQHSHRVNQGTTMSKSRSVTARSSASVSKRKSSGSSESSSGGTSCLLAVLGFAVIMTLVLALFLPENDEPTGSTTAAATTKFQPHDASAQNHHRKLFHGTDPPTVAAVASSAAIPKEGLRGRAAAHAASKKDGGLPGSSILPPVSQSRIKSSSGRRTALLPGVDLSHFDFTRVDGGAGGGTGGGTIDVSNGDKTKQRRKDSACKVAEATESGGLSKTDRDLVWKYASKATNLLEWNQNGSELQFITRKLIGKHYAISPRDGNACVKKDSVSRCLESEGRLKMLCAGTPPSAPLDMRKPSASSSPSTENSAKSIGETAMTIGSHPESMAYITMIEQLLQQDFKNARIANLPIDLVYIGNVAVSPMLPLLFALRFTDAKSVFLVRGFWEDPTAQAIALKYFDIVDGAPPPTAGTLQPSSSSSSLSTLTTSTKSEVDDHRRNNGKGDKSGGAENDAQQQPSTVVALRQKANIPPIAKIYSYTLIDSNFSPMTSSNAATVHESRNAVVTAADGRSVPVVPTDKAGKNMKGGTVEGSKSEVTKSASGGTVAKDKTIVANVSEFGEEKKAQTGSDLAAASGAKKGNDKRDDPRHERNANEDQDSNKKKQREQQKEQPKTSEPKTSKSSESTKTSKTGDNASNEQPPAATSPSKDAEGVPPSASLSAGEANAAAAASKVNGEEGHEVAKLKKTDAHLQSADIEEEGRMRVAAPSREGETGSSKAAGHVNQKKVGKDMDDDFNGSHEKNMANIYHTSNSKDKNTMSASGGMDKELPLHKGDAGDGTTTSGKTDMPQLGGVIDEQEGEGRRSPHSDGQRGKEPKPTDDDSDDKHEASQDG